MILPAHEVLDSRTGNVRGRIEPVNSYLDNEPVLARPPSAMYRMRKFIRRHRAGVAASAAIEIIDERDPTDLEALPPRLQR